MTNAGREDCEWMFGDVNCFARLNPVRWSGSLSFVACSAMLEEQQKAKANRPIVIKAPSGVLSKEQRFLDCLAAIQWLKDNDPAKKSISEKLSHARSDLELKKQAMKTLEEEIASDSETCKAEAAKLEELQKQVEELRAQAGLDCEWMFGDLNPGARLNPVRWSGSLSFAACSAELEEQQKAEANRPIVIKAPSGVLSQEQRFDECQTAIQWLKGIAEGTKVEELQKQVDELRAQIDEQQKAIDQKMQNLEIGKVELEKAEEYANKCEEEAEAAGVVT